MQTTVYRLEAKGALRRTRKIGNAYIFEPIVERGIARHRLLDTIPSFFGGRRCLHRIPTRRTSLPQCRNGWG